jgi:ribosome maturation factor RimP
MGLSADPERIRALAEPAAASAGLVVEDMTVTRVGRRLVLRVIVDLPPDAVGGVPMDAVASASQGISTALDAHDVMGASPYVLEVSSPGVDRPLTKPRHWMRARGRLVRAILADGTTVGGRLRAVSDDGIELEGLTPIAWDGIRRGHVEVEFSPDVEREEPAWTST